MSSTLVYDGGMPLLESEYTQVWESWLNAEAYAYYFADLTNRYSRQKQIIAFVSLFTSSGAAVTVLSRGPAWIAVVLSVMVAAASAYTVAFGLDMKVKTMAKLHYSWAQIGSEYEWLWNHTYDNEAEERLTLLIRRAQDLSELAATDAPNDQKALARWQVQVFRMHHLAA